MNNTSKWWVIAILVILLLLACWYFFLRPKTTTTEQNNQSQSTGTNGSNGATGATGANGSNGANGSAGANAPQNLTIPLQTQNSSGVAGNVTFTQTPNGTDVVLNTVGGPLNLSLPAHINSGTCANPGAVKYTLNSTVNGKSDTTVNANMADLTANPMSVSVDKSAAGVTANVACANIVAQ
ncbi:MAG: hypothetical protein WDN47_01570 [Candidatus Doudnabacteria bacterium]